ncbi:MAG: tetratricopeptide repeat protein [Anaerolineae bacterium]|nr:tetratricopeptide repeat protein [Anaerolineae bacterium]
MVINGLPLVRSKLLVPSPAGLLHRPRLCRAIERGLACRLTLISAPAGYGKTSALVDFAQSSSIPVCWYTADERDRDLGLFVEYLVGAIGEQFSDFGERTQAALASLVGDFVHIPAGVAEELANEILALDVPLAVVIDNYESLDGTLGIRGFIRRFLEILPPNCHLMLGSRVLPDVPVTRLVAGRQLVGLAARDLQFSSQEIQDLLQLSQFHLSEAQAEAIAASSEGWITGILLLADLLREDAQAALFDAREANAETYGYLAAEVLDRQPPDVQHFLCTSVVLREMSVPLCREVLRIGEPGGLLAEVERRNLFITRFGRGAGATFRYHNLFRDFLHQQLRQRDPAHYAELHLRTAAWFDEANDVEEAVYHYLAAEAYPEAIALMERVAREWFVRGRVETLLGWAQELPESIKPQAPRLLLYQGKVLTDRHDYERARRVLTYAETGFGERGGQAVDLAEVHNQRALLELFEGQYESAIVEAQTALKLLGEGQALEQVNAHRYIGKAYIWLGRLDEGVAKLRDVLALYRKIGSPYDVVNSLQDLGTVLIDLGHFDEAAICLNEALAIARRLGALSRLAMLLNDFGYLYHLRGEYQNALVLYEEGLAVARRGDEPRGQAYIAVGMADLYRDLGLYERAALLYDAGQRLSGETEPNLTVYILLAQADMHRWRGDLSQAFVLLQRARCLAEEKGFGSEMQGLLPVAEGIALAESGQVELGLGVLTDGIDFLERHHMKRELGRAYFLLAKAHSLAGGDVQAVAALRRAMDVANEIGTFQFAVAEGQRASAIIDLGIDTGIALCHDVAAGVKELQSLSGSQSRFGMEEEGRVPHLKIYALGEGQVVCDGHVLSSSDWQAAMAKELFFYILLNAPLERDVIGVVFWPDLPPKKMSNSFHTTLHRIRRAVGSQTVVVKEGLYRLGDVEYWFDVEEFESLIARARLLPPHDWQAEDLWRRALALYRGDFLPEVERIWCISKREALREMYIEALIGMGRCHEARRDFEGAVAWYRRALEMDELREDIHCLIMRCYVEAGQRSKALAQYRHCEKILREELGLEPSLETRRLYEHISGVGSG